MHAPQSSELRSKFEPVALAPTEQAIPRSPTAKSPTPRGFRARRWIILLGISAAIAIGAVALKARSAKAINYATAPATRGNIARVTTASGMVNPVETVQIGSYVSGRIKDLYCDYNTKVAKDQICAKIDPSSYQAAVDQSAAAVGTAKAQLGKDQAQLAYAKLSYQRNSTLLKRDVVSQDAADNALNAYEQAEAQVSLDQATIIQREAELKAAQVNLDYTNIVSPVDGTVVSRSVAIGQTVTANFQTPTLFLIAKDLTKMQVEANVSEAEIGDIHEGQNATFTVEAFPGRTFSGQVTQIRQAPVSVQNVISYDVVISANNSDLALKPGMTATAHIVTAQQHNVLRVPQSALRFAPQGDAPKHERASIDKSGVIWLKHGDVLTPITVQLGLADENTVEVTGSALHAGDEVVTGAGGAVEAASSDASRDASGMP